MTIDFVSRVITELSMTEMVKATPLKDIVQNGKVRTIQMIEDFLFS